MSIGGIRNRNPSKLAAADLRLRPRGHLDRQTTATHTINLLPSSDEVENEWSYTPTPLICLHGKNKDSYNFTFVSVATT